MTAEAGVLGFRDSGGLRMFRYLLAPLDAKARTMPRIVWLLRPPAWLARLLQCLGAADPEIGQHAVVERLQHPALPPPSSSSTHPEQPTTSCHAAWQAAKCRVGYGGKTKLNTSRHRNTPVQVLLPYGVRIEHNRGLTFRSGTKHSCLRREASQEHHNLRGQLRITRCR